MTAPAPRPMHLIIAHRRLIATARDLSRSGHRAHAARNLALAARARTMLAQANKKESAL